MLNKADGSNALAGALHIGGGSAALARRHQVGDGSAMTMTGGSLDLNGCAESCTETLGGLAGTGGCVNLGGGSLPVLQNWPAADCASACCALISRFNTIRPS